MMIVPGSSQGVLALDLATTLGCPILPIERRVFKDEEIHLKLTASCLNADVVILQSTSCPVHDRIIELALLADASRRGGARSIKACVPYWSYSRQDRTYGLGSPLPARVIAGLFDAMTLDGLIIFDLHSPPSEGFFKTPLTHLSAHSLLMADIHQRFQKPVIVAPDFGALKRVRAMGVALGTDIAVIDKERLGPGDVIAHSLLGNVQDRVCVLYDDLVDSGGTLIEAAKNLKAQGAQEVHGYAVHGVLSGGDLKSLPNSALSTLTVTNTIERFMEQSEFWRAVSILPILKDHFQSPGPSIYQKV